MMRKLILAVVPLVVVLTGCGESSRYESTSYSNSSYDSSYATESQPPYRSSEGETYNTSYRSSPPFGNYPVNSCAVCKTG